MFLQRALGRLTLGRPDPGRGLALSRHCPASPFSSYSCAHSGPDEPATKGVARSGRSVTPTTKPPPRPAGPTGDDERLDDVDRSGHTASELTRHGVATRFSFVANTPAARPRLHGTPSIFVCYRRADEPFAAAMTASILEDAVGAARGLPRHPLPAPTWVVRACSPRGGPELPNRSRSHRSGVGQPGESRPARQNRRTGYVASSWRLPVMARRSCRCSSSATAVPAVPGLDLTFDRRCRDDRPERHRAPGRRSVPSPRGHGLGGSSRARASRAGGTRPPAARPAASAAVDEATISQWHAAWRRSWRGASGCGSSRPATCLASRTARPSST